MKIYNYKMTTNIQNFGFDLCNEMLKNNNLPVFMCIGSAFVVSDSIGPVVGSLLTNKYNIETYVYGNLKNNITKENLNNYYNFIKKKHLNSKIIVIDSGLSELDKIGLVKFNKGSIYTGAENINYSDNAEHTNNAGNTNHYNNTTYTNQTKTFNHPTCCNFLGKTGYPIDSSHHTNAGYSGNPNNSADLNNSDNSSHSTDYNASFGNFGHSTNSCYHTSSNNSGSHTNSGNSSHSNNFGHSGRPNNSSCHANSGNFGHSGVFNKKGYYNTQHSSHFNIENFCNSGLKNLSAIGDYYILGIVNTTGINNLIFLKSIKLDLCLKISNFIANSINYAFNLYKKLKNKSFIEN